MSSRNLSVTLFFLAACLWVNPGNSQSLLDKLKDEVEDVTGDTTQTSTPQSVQAAGSKLLSDEQNCRGRWGIGCWDVITGSKNPTQYEYPCDGDGDLVCVTSRMTIGSIKHDICCDAHNSENEGGHWCWSKNPKEKDDNGDNVCKAEWNQAFTDWSNKKFFEHTWRYEVGDTSQQVAANWWLGMAPDGTRVTQKNPQDDKIFCHANAVEKVGGKWVCSGKPPDTPSDVNVAEAVSSTSDRANESPSAEHAIGNIDTGPLGEWEIAGLHLGMTPEQVRTTLVTKYPYAKLMDSPCCLSTLNTKGVVGQFKAVPGKGNYYQQTLRAVIQPSGNSGIGESFEFNVFFLMIEDAEERLRSMPRPSGNNRENRAERTARLGSMLFASEIHFAHRSPGKFSFNPKDFIRSRFGDFGEMGKDAKREVSGEPAFRGSPTRMTVRFGYSSNASKQNFADSTIGNYTIEYGWIGVEAHIEKLVAANKRYMEELELEHQRKLKAAEEPF